MKTWLFTWNPKHWPWNSSDEGYKELRKEISQMGFTLAKWSCGGNKSIEMNDRIFLIRLGVEDRGIVASGYAETAVFKGIHWDPEKAAKGMEARRIYIRFDRILDIDAGECLKYEKLMKINPKYHWSPQSSGVSIPDKTAEKLEEEWKRFDKK